MAFVSPEAKALLAEIGKQLDADCYPVIYNGGIVQPSNPSVQTHLQGKESEYDERTRERRSATRPRQRPARRQGPAYRPWPPSGTTPFVDAGVRRAYEAELEDVRSAYPGAKVWLRGKGVWLLTESLVLHGLTKRATFLTAVPFIRGSRAQAWGYWTTAISASWIGPRHTNFPDGSICAFEPRDDTWSIGESIIKLLDLYTLWALRHLHLELFGRWAGYQSVPIPYERLQELQDDEFCGCDRSHLRYSECCKSADLALDPQKTFVDFVMRTGGGNREPPKWVLPVIWGSQLPPDIW